MPSLTSKRSQGRSLASEDRPRSEGSEQTRDPKLGVLRLAVRRSLSPSWEPERRPAGDPAGLARGAGMHSTTHGPAQRLDVLVKDPATPVRALSTIV